MKVLYRDSALPRRALSINHCIERHECDRHIGRVDRDTVLTCAEDRVLSMKSANRSASTPRIALIALREVRLHKIRATCALDQISSRCSHVAELRRGPAKDGVRDERVVGPNDLVVRN